MLATKPLDASQSDFTPNALLAVDVVLFTIRGGPPADALPGAACPAPRPDRERPLDAAGVLVPTGGDLRRRGTASARGGKPGSTPRPGTSSSLPPTGSRRAIAAVGSFRWHTWRSCARTTFACASTAMTARPSGVPVGRIDNRVLAFDHAEMIRVGIQRIRSKLRYSWVAFQLLNETFTLPELRSVYAAILDPSGPIIVG